MLVYFFKRRKTMKKLLVLLFMLVLMLSLAACDLIPGLNGSSNHECEFVLKETVEPGCTREGKTVYECSICGETKEEPIAALGHDMQFLEAKVVNCDQYGAEIYKCSRCIKKETRNTPPSQHEWGDVVESSRLVKCTKEGCTGVKLADGNGKYAEDLVFSFGDSDKAALDAVHNELAAILEAAEDYNSELHGYAESGELYDAYMVAEGLYEDYSDLIFAAQGQYSIAMTLYYCDHKNEELETIYNDMQNYYTDLVSKFYSLSEPWYDSMFREFFFYGATEDEIKEFLSDSKALSDPEYIELKARNDAIELEYNALKNPEKTDEILALYAEFVENNNRIAEILGYDNYLEYAYQNVYDRDYTYQDVAAFVEYVKEYMAPIFNRVYGQFNSVSGYNEKDLEDYYSVVKYSFFENPLANELFNDYIDEMQMAFTSNPDKQISFSDNLNNLMSDGNLFRGTYEGAYVTFIYNKKIPIAYFGQGYDNTTTIAHEFGHYMNEVYNLSEYNQSYDLLETHSQGQEFLYLHFVEGRITDKAYELVELQQVLNTLYIIMAAVQVDCFEQAIYLNSYDGYNSDIIMADGKITSDEYDLLYESLSVELGIDESYRNDTYWRMGMTISSPCYYISYSVSAINALQLYAKTNTEGFEAGKESYLKLFTYTDTLESDEDYMTVEEVLLYAGLLSYNDEQTYKNIANFLMSN